MPPRARALRRPVFGRDDRALRTTPVVVHTDDGMRWDGMLYRPGRREGERRRTAVLVVHGSVGNYLSGVPRRVSFGLARAGFSVLAVNTRMANYGVFFGGGLMHRTPRDLDAAMALLRRLGFRRVVMLGYSMGATMVAHHQATRRAPEVAGLCTLAHPVSLPVSLRRRWNRYGAVPSYSEFAARARGALLPDPERGDDRIVVVRRARGPSERPEHAEVWTYRTWWFSRGPEAHHAVSRLQVPYVTVPMGLVQAGEDELVPAEEGPELARLALEGACPAAEVVRIAGADHVFAGREGDLVAACEAWIATLPA
jgi:dienelactone hydrolase